MTRKERYKYQYERGCNFIKQELEIYKLDENYTLYTRDDLLMMMKCNANNFSEKIESDPEYAFYCLGIAVILKIKLGEI